MLQIRNVADFPVLVSTSYMGGQGRPLYIKLGPGEHKLVGQEEVGKWPNGAKENLAESMQMGHLVVNELTAVHSPKDDGHVLPEFSACNLGSAIVTAAGTWSNVTGRTEGWSDVYNAHVLNQAVHSAPDTANMMTLARPTDLTTLVAYVTAMKAKFNAHIGAGVHANADTVNTIGLPVPADLPTCIESLGQLYGRFNVHKKQFSASGAWLTPDDVIALV
jgi:hypothetical protein